MLYLIFDFDLRIKVTPNTAQYPLHHVTYAAAKFEVATFNSFGSIAVTRKYNILPFDLGVKVT